MNRILLIDTEPTTRASIRGRLQSDGYHVTDCETKEQLVDEFHRGIDAVVVCGPPVGMTCTQVVQELLSAEPEIPIISACSTTDETLEALNHGAAYVARQPVNSDEIAILVRRAVCDAERSRKMSSPPVSEQLPPMSGLRPTVDYRLPAQGIDFRELEREVLTQALRLAGGNQTRAASLLRLTRDQIRYRMAKFGITSRDSSSADDRAA